MRTEYLIRLDDACPTMDAGRWSEVEEVLTRHDVKPIVAMVPANEDPGLIRGPVNEKFWTQAQGWARSGWTLALHGYSHALRPSSRGLVPVSLQSEFVGLPLEEQKRRIREGVGLLQQRGLAPLAWVAPAHGADRNTLEALKAESSIRLISDCFTRRPVKRWGFTWIPQQLWRPRNMPGGLWTICLHPNEMSQADIANLGFFISCRPGAFPDPSKAGTHAVPYGPLDFAFETAYSSMIRLRRLASKRNPDG